MRIHYLALGLIFGLVLTAGTVMAQQAKPGDIGGTIFTPEGRIAPGATVIATHQTAGTSFQDVADDKGRFRIRKVPPGEYKIESRFQGVSYRYPALVRVNPGETTVLCLQMERENNILKLREERCEPEPVAVIWPYVVAGAGAVGAVVAAVLILQEEPEASPTRP